MPHKPSPLVSQILILPSLLDCRNTSQCLLDGSLQAFSLHHLHTHISHLLTICSQIFELKRDCSSQSTLILNTPPQFVVPIKLHKN